MHAWQVAPLIKNEMQRRGDAMIGFQAVNGRPNFFRIVFASCDIVSREDIDGSLAFQLAKACMHLSLIHI